MTFSEATAYLQALRPAGMQMGLTRMEHAMNVLGHPERTFPVIHVAGTNGKGSTSAMIAAALTANGYKTALFSSPAVTGITETLQIDGTPVSEQDFADTVERVVSAIPQGLSEFECLTATMFTYFAQSHVDVAVIECGLGGKDDATNVIPAPLCAVLTPIGLDHTAVLGDTVEAIAQHKSGIIKRGCDVVCAPSMNADALGVIYETAASLGCTVIQPSEKDVLTVDSVTYTPTMPSRHQVGNAVTAMAVLETVSRRFPVKPDICAKAIAAVTLPCRLEYRDGPPPLMLDGGHNPQKIEPLCEWLQSRGEPATLIIGMLQDKEYETVVRMLAPYCRRILCCTPPHTPRPALKADVLAACAKQYHHDVTVAEDPEKAYNDAKNTPDTTLIVAGGSFYTAAAVRKAATQ